MGDIELAEEFLKQEKDFESWSNERGITGEQKYWVRHYVLNRMDRR